ncbi:MAG: FAD-dependent monooxygenase [Chloroflexota bacterium]
MTKQKNDHPQRKHAIVIGGSMAGMFAARVLTDYYQQVTILDRDQFPETPDHRSGVPQSQHAHALLAKGQQIVEGHFPGITAELLAKGGAPATGGSIVVITPYGKLAGSETGNASQESVDSNPLENRNNADTGVFASRIMLEWQIREHLRKHTNVKILSGVEVTELIASPDNSQVTGVRLRRRGADSRSRPEQLNADLVVDASGRRSKAPEWLTDLGYGAPPEETINSQIGYASRFYRKPANFPASWQGLIINARVPDNPRAGLILPIENDMWHVTVGGFAGHYPPSDEEGFMAWAKALPDPSLYESLLAAEPVTEIRQYRTPSNRLRHFERLPAMPTGFVVMGDAVCAFNPIYGQGMTTSAVGSLVLKEALAADVQQPQPDFEKRFQQSLAQAVADAWFIATSEDLRWAGVELSGATPSRLPALMRPYMNQLLKAARHDATISAAYFEMINMVRRPQSLFQPAIMIRVLRSVFQSQSVETEEYALTHRQRLQLMTAQ